ncbi:MAG: 3-oxoacyl-[acyl-carrier-protein] reductase FabG [Bacteroidota bacterium]|jgi:NAD(P)-dependent dehydrogenase (short-subunit alcohol dehydrogenase family)
MKTILLIGASSAVAKEVAKQLKLQGQTVISISRTEPDAPYDIFQIHDISTNEPMPVIEGCIDGLVYFPGTINLKQFQSLKEVNFQNDFQINVLGAIKSIQSYSKNLALSDSASIILFSTVAVQIGMPFHASVAASKGAIEGLTRSLAAEFAPKIRVNCIAPSLTNTPMASRLLSTPEKIEASALRHPLKKVGDPKDLANMTTFLLSDASKWMTGQILHLDGGMSSIK